MALVAATSAWDATPLAATAVEPTATAVDNAKPVTTHPSAVEVTAAPIDLGRASTGALMLADGTTIRPSSPTYTPPSSATEVVSLRDEGSRVTANPDGTFTLEASSGRLNYRDAAGMWQPIDLTLVTDQATGDLKVKGLDRDVTIGTGSDGFLGSVSTPSGGATLRAVGYGGGQKVADTEVVVFSPGHGEAEPAPSAEPSPDPTSPPSAEPVTPAPSPTASLAPSASPEPAPVDLSTPVPSPSASPSATPQPAPSALPPVATPSPSPEPSAATPPTTETGGAHVTAAGHDQGLEFGAVINDRSAPRSFSFILAVEPGTTATLAADGRSILLERPNVEDGGATSVQAGRVSAPFVSDADAVGPTEAVTVALLRAGDTSTDAELPQSVLDGLGPNEVVLSYRIDDEWLDDPERVFPVTLDPTLCMQHESTSCNPANAYFDTYGGSSQAGTYPTSPSTLRVGWDAIGSPDAVWGLLRTYIYFGQVALADGAQVTGASLVLRQDINRDGAERNFLARPMKVGWGDTSTWNQLHDKVLTGLDSPNVLSCATDGTNCDLVFDVSKAVRAWNTRRGADWKHNAGFEIKLYDEDPSHAESDFYVGDDPSTIGGRPELIINYVIPKVALDFAPELGANYAPSSMVAGQATKLPLRVTNASSGFSWNACSSGSDADCYRVGYRFFNTKGTVVVSATQDLPSAIGSGTTTAVSLAVTPPPTPGTYTLRLDLVHRLGGTSGTYLWASDWAKPSLFNSRDKKVFAPDNTRWTGSSVIERDEFGVTVSVGASGGSDRSVDTGDGGSLSIDLATRNLHYDGVGGIGFADLLPLDVSYGYDSKNAVADCPSGAPTSYVGILDACGWYTNWDEHLTDRSSADNSGAFVYQDPSGTRSFLNTDAEGQVQGAAGSLVERMRITLFDENGGGGTTATGKAVVGTSESPSVTPQSGTYILATDAASNVSLTSYVPVSMSLNSYRHLTFSMRTTAATGTGIAFKIHDVSDPSVADAWFGYTVGTDYPMGLTAQAALGGGSPVGTWRTFTTNLYNDVRAALPGGTYDDYEIVGIQTRTKSGSAGLTYLDAVYLSPGSGYPISEAVPGFNANAAKASLVAGGANGTANAVKVTPGTLATSPQCTNVSCWAGNGLYAFPFTSWDWRKVGGDSIAIRYELKDLRPDSGGQSRRSIKESLSTVLWARTS